MTGPRPTCTKTFSPKESCGEPATLAYVSVENKFYYRCEKHPIVGNRRGLGHDLIQARKIPLEKALLMEVLNK